MRIAGLVLMIGLAGLGQLTAAEPGALRAGAATSVITPQLGVGIVGNFRIIPATHVHDELHVRSLVLDNGLHKIVLVTCDLLGFHRAVSDEARRLIQEETGIPRENVLISSTHTHSASSALGKNYYQPEQPVDDYQRFVARRIGDCVRCAVNRLRPAEIAFGTADAPEHVFNRRWYMRPGTMPANPFGKMDLVKMNPPAGSPNLTEPAGPTDPVISIMAVREPDGQPIALYASYSLHYVGGVGPGHISADYFAMFCDELIRLEGLAHREIPYVPMLANGTSGDVNNINFRTPRPPKGAYEQMRAVAHDVASKVHEAVKGFSWQKEIVLGARYREPVIQSRKPTPEELEWSVKTLEAAGPDENTWDIPAIYAQRLQDLAQVPDTLPVPLQVIRIGEVGMGTMPAETFCEIGLEFKERSALQPASLISIAHGYMGYLPTPRHHELGGYETWLGTSRLEKDASVKMLNELVEMSKELAAE